jgi:flagellar hook-associated protein 3 FlgL
MALAPFAPGGVQVRRTAEMFVQLRKQGVDLERQLTTGKKAESFGALGFARRTSLDLRSKLSALDGFQSSIKDADLRLKMMLQSTGNLQKIASSTRAGALLPSSGVSGANPLEQVQAQGNLKLAIDLLNENINGRYLFSGAAHDVKPVVSYEQIVDGVRDAIALRKTADNGGGTGFLTTSSGANSVTVTDTLPGSGFDIAGATSSSGSIVASGPPNASFNVTMQPNAGDTISLRLSLPDGSEEIVTLKAVAGAAGAGEFQIGAGVAGTAGNLEAALGAAIMERAGSALAAASSVAAAREFFDDDANWYRGDPGPAVDARSTAPVRIDATQSVGTGAQANEQSLKTLLTQLAVLSAETFVAGDQKRYEALLTRVAGNLTPGANEQKISDIGIELGNAHASMDSARQRHQATSAILQNSLGDIEDAPSEEVAAKLLALQTRLQASYQTTSLLSKLSLVNYL